jgi:hypothetical protein
VPLGHLPSSPYAMGSAAYDERHAAPRGPYQSQPGRVCAAAGCTTILSRYNHDPVCWPHRARPRPRATRRPADVAAAEVAARDERVLRLLRERPRTHAEVRDELRLTYAQATHALCRLRDAGRAEAHRDPEARARQLWRAVDPPS